MYCLALLPCPASPSVVHRPPCLFVFACVCVSYAPYPFVVSRLPLPLRGLTYPSLTQRCASGIRYTVYERLLARLRVAHPPQRIVSLFDDLAVDSR